ncbi:VOC family protein [Nocardioides sp. YIM 152315]|uniref:VOC family protein n=1 Tax=Nocardioides sp. YIM 152315 TaxID=3031760 RepID=UPI0023DAD390|nr:VOC family protein [Nocardioides sp. YIM 152315]MDF1604805.1 VOC family protein [Nocardioides sp. YIM 152315]
MITHISIASVFVDDVDVSRDFYVDVLGFELKDDITLGGGYRWCTVNHPSQPELAVHLTTPGPPFSDEFVAAMQRERASGGLNGLGMSVDDCQKTYEELSARGVEFLQKPEERPYGVEALCRDNSGNWIVLVEPREFTAQDFA